MKRILERRIEFCWTEEVEVPEFDNNEEYEAKDGWEVTLQYMIEAGEIASAIQDAIEKQAANLREHYDTACSVSNFEWQPFLDDYPAD